MSAYLRTHFGGLSEKKNYKNAAQRFKKSKHLHIISLDYCAEFFQKFVFLHYDP